LECGGGAATAGATAPCARSGRPPDLLFPVPDTYARTCVKWRGRARPQNIAKHTAFAARRSRGVATVRASAQGPVRCAAALCTWLPEQRLCSGGRAASRCVMGTPGVLARPKRGAGRWAAPRGAGAPGAGGKGRKSPRAVLTSFLPVHVVVTGKCACACKDGRQPLRCQNRALQASEQRADRDRRGSPCGLSLSARCSDACALPPEERRLPAAGPRLHARECPLGVGVVCSGY